MVSRSIRRFRRCKRKSWKEIPGGNDQCQRLKLLKTYSSVVPKRNPFELKLTGKQALLVEDAVVRHRKANSGPETHEIYQVVESCIRIPLLASGLLKFTQNVTAKIGVIDIVISGKALLFLNKICSEMVTNPIMIDPEFKKAVEAVNKHALSYQLQLANETPKKCE